MECTNSQVLVDVGHPGKENALPGSHMVPGSHLECQGGHLFRPCRSHGVFKGVVASMLPSEFWNPSGLGPHAQHAGIPSGALRYKGLRPSVIGWTKSSPAPRKLCLKNLCRCHHAAVVPHLFKNGFIFSCYAAISVYSITVDAQLSSARTSRWDYMSNLTTCDPICLFPSWRIILPSSTWKSILGENEQQQNERDRGKLSGQ